MATNDQLKESVRDQIIKRSIVSWFAGTPVPIKVCGSATKIGTMIEALNATKRFQRTLEASTSSVATVMEALEKKHLASESFAAAFKMKWPL